MLKRIRRLLPALLLCATACIWLLGARLSADHTSAKPRAESDEPANRQHQVVCGIGYVEPASQIRRLVFKVDGVIESCRVEIGQTVAKGDVLMTLRNRDELAAAAIAEQELGLAVAERDRLISSVNPFQITAAERKVDLFTEQARHAVSEFQRAQKLFESHFSTAADYDKSRTDVVQAQASLHQAEAEVLQLRNFVRAEDRAVAEAKIHCAQARLESARHSLENMVLLAPCNGTVLEILRREGEGAHTTDPEPVLVFADRSQLRIRAEIDERHVHDVHAGQTAVIHGRGLGQQQFIGHVAFVKPLMGNKTLFSRTSDERKDLDVVQVLIDLPGDFRAPLGLQADVEVQADGAK